MKKNEVSGGLEQMLISLDEFGCEDIKYYEKVVDNALHLIKEKKEGENMTLKGLVWLVIITISLYFWYLIFTSLFCGA